MSDFLFFEFENYYINNLLNFTKSICNPNSMTHNQQNMKIS